MMRRTSKWGKLVRWLALMLCVSVFCLPMVGAMTEDEGTVAMEVVPVEPAQADAAPEPEPPQVGQSEPMMEPVEPEQAIPDPQPPEHEDVAPVPDPEPKSEPEPPALEPGAQPDTPSNAGDEPTPIPNPSPEPEPIEPPTSDPTQEPTPNPTAAPEPTPTSEPTPVPIATCPPPTKPPTPDALYNVLVDAPTVWMTKPAQISIRIEDVNGVGWSSVIAQVALPIGTQDISAALTANGIAIVEITDNCIVQVSIIDPAGAPHEFTRDVVCFDRNPPVLKAKIDGRVLRMNVTDDLSGIAWVYVNDQKFEELNDGALDVAIKKLGNYTEYKQLTLCAVDWAGNTCEPIKLKNPLYKSSGSSGSSGSSNGGGAAPVYPAKPTPPAATATPEPTDVPETPVASPTPVPMPTPTPEPNPFSVDGTGTVLNYAGTSDGKEFFIITTPDGSTFYLVIDRQRGTENVYFLDAATERDLLSLAEASGQVMPTPEPTPMPVTTPIPTPEPAPEPPPPKKGNGSMIFIVILISLAAGGAGYYFKIMRPKQQQDMAEYDEADELDDEPDDMDYDDEDEPLA